MTRQHPDLEHADILAALEYAAAIVIEREVAIARPIRSLLDPNLSSAPGRPAHRCRPHRAAHLGTGPTGRRGHDDLRPCCGGTVTLPPRASSAPKYPPCPPEPMTAMRGMPASMTPTRLCVHVDGDVLNRLRHAGGLTSIRRSMTREILNAPMRSPNPGNGIDQSRTREPPIRRVAQMSWTSQLALRSALTPSTISASMRGWTKSAAHRCLGVVDTVVSYNDDQNRASRPSCLHKARLVNPTFTPTCTAPRSQATPADITADRIAVGQRER